MGVGRAAGLCLVQLSQGQVEQGRCEKDESEFDKSPALMGQKHLGNAMVNMRTRERVEIELAK